jgi:hypothetical protein
MKNRRHTPEQTALLREIIANGLPRDADRLLAVSPREWTRTDRDLIRDAIAAELSNGGFRPDWEPTPRGLLLEDLIDFVTRLEILADPRTG